LVSGATFALEVWEIPEENSAHIVQKEGAIFVRLRPDGNSGAFRRGAVGVEPDDGGGQRLELRDGLFEAGTVGRLIEVPRG
jgi:hypothetical protein